MAIRLAAAPHAYEAVDRNGDDDEDDDDESGVEPGDSKHGSIVGLGGPEIVRRRYRINTVPATDARSFARMTGGGSTGPY
jgi:hypothetical protein